MIRKKRYILNYIFFVLFAILLLFNVIFFINKKKSKKKSLNNNDYDITMELEDDKNDNIIIKSINYKITKNIEYNFIDINNIEKLEKLDKNCNYLITTLDKNEIEYILLNQVTRLDSNTFKIENNKIYSLIKLETHKDNLYVLNEIFDINNLQVIQIQKNNIKLVNNSKKISNKNQIFNHEKVEKITNLNFSSYFYDKNFLYNIIINKNFVIKTKSKSVENLIS